MCAEDGEVVKGLQEQTAGSFHLLMSSTVTSHTEPCFLRATPQAPGSLGGSQNLLEHERRMKTGTAGAMD